jgi:hypothetical protein
VVTRGLALALAAVVATGCGTVLGSRPAAVRLTSFPAGATVVVDGAAAGVTPTTVHVAPDRAHEIRLTLGTQTASCDIKSGVIGKWIALDIITGVLPLVVDAVTGAWRNTHHDGCEVRFAPVDGRVSRARNP